MTDKKTICLELSQYNWENSGIAEYERRLAAGLFSAFGDRLRGTAHRIRVTAAPFPVTRAWSRYDWAFSDEKARHFPFPYHWLNGRFCRDDVYVFFRNQIPYQRIRGKVVAVIHDLISLRVPGYSDAERTTYRKNVQRVLERADRVVTVSEYSRQDIAWEFGYAADRIAVVSPGVDAAFFAQTRAGEESELASFGVPKVGDYLLYFGSHSPQKNLPALLRGYAQLPRDVRARHPLVMNGRADADLVAETQALGITSDVHFIGHAPENLKGALYRHARAFVFLSSCEGFGMPLIEAMAAGTPVVCSDCTALPEVAGDAALVVDPGDAQAVAANLERALEDEAVRTDLIEKGKRRAGVFSWEEAVRKMVEVINAEVGAMFLTQRSREEE